MPPAVELSCLSAAKDIALDAADREPGPAPILAVVAILSWSQTDPMKVPDGGGLNVPRLDFNRGWWHLPAACTAVGIKAGGYRAALEMILQSYDFVHSITAKSTYGHPLLVEYRKVARGRR